MSGKLFQARKNKTDIEDMSKEVSENFEINLLDNLHSTITCIRIHSLHLDIGNSVNLNKNNYNSYNKEENNSNTIITKKSKVIKNFIFLSTTKGNISILYNCKKVFIRLNDFLAHPPQPENRDLRFGSLKFKAEVWSIAIKEKYRNELENKLIVNIFSASEDQMVKIWEINLFDLLNYKDILNELCIRSKVKLEQIPNDISLFIVEEVKAYKNHALAVTSVDCKIVKIQDTQKRVLATCSDDKVINIYNAEDDSEFSYIGSLTTKGNVVGWHTITYLSLEEVRI